MLLTLTILVSLMAAAMAAIGIAWLVSKRRRNAAPAGETRDLHERLEASEGRVQELEGEANELRAKSGISDERVQSLTSQLARANEELGKERDLDLRTKLGTSDGRVQELEARLERTTKRLDEEREKVTELLPLQERVKRLGEMEKVFGTAAKEALTANRGEVLKEGQENLNTVVDPLKKELKEFRERMDKIHTESVTRGTSLQTKIEQLQQQARKYGESADNLANTLKGDSKVQGDWGEVTLAKLLEKSGLREGHEYKTQASVRSVEGELLRPDVVVYLPDDKHLILDSKVSLRDYYAFVNHDDEGARARHLRAVRDHVKALAGKDYPSVTGLKAPDFVFMFMPIEPAFIVALRDDPELFTYAYDRGVALCTPTTLMTILRTVERIWRIDQRNRESEEIARLAKSLHDKIAGFVENMEKIGNALDRAHRAYGDAHGQLITGRGSAVSIVRKFKGLGISSSKALPESVEGEAEPMGLLDAPAADDDEAS